MHVKNSGKLGKVGRVTRAESVDDEPPITMAQAAAIRSFFEGARIMFVADDGDEPGVRMRKVEQKDAEA